jgi:hypothetical protein
MKKGFPFLAATSAVLMLLLLFVTQTALAAKSPKLAAPKSFQAQFTYQVGANTPEQGTMYFSHGRIREEVTPIGDGPKKITIIDPLQKTIYQIDANKKAFKVLPWDARSALISEALKRFEKHKLVDTKTIDGQQCEDFEIRPKDPTIRPFYLFVNKETRFPVQLTTVDPDPSKEIHIKWSNLTPGYQAAILFDPPLGYAEMK